MGFCVFVASIGEGTVEICRVTGNVMYQVVVAYSETVGNNTIKDAHSFVGIVPLVRLPFVVDNIANVYYEFDVLPGCVISYPLCLPEITYFV